MARLDVSDAPAALAATLTIPRRHDSSHPPLLGRLYWPDANVAAVKLGVIWSPANPGKKWGSASSLSPMPTALAEACEAAKLPLLRFDYKGVNGSGGASFYSDPSDPRNTAPMPDQPDEDFADALAYLETRCELVAVVGMSMGASTMLGPAAASRKLSAVCHINVGPDISKYLFAGDKVKMKACDDSIVDAHAALPAGVPKLFLVGSRDKDITPMSTMRTICAQTPQPWTLEEVAGMNHACSGFEAAMAKRVVDFLLAEAHTAQPPQQAAATVPLTDLGSLLAQLGLGQHAAAFADEGYDDLSMLRAMSDAELLEACTDCGVTAEEGQRVVAALRPGATSQAAPNATSEPPSSPAQPVAAASSGITDVTSLLAQLGLGQHAAAFAGEGYDDLSMLGAMSDAELLKACTDCGVTAEEGHRVVASRSEWRGPRGA